MDPASAAAVAAGGALGAVGRWLVGGWAATALGTGFPWGVLIVNVAGGLAMGVVAGLAGAAPRPGGPLHLFLATGVLGGFTTFSAFSLDVVAMLEAGRHAAAAAYVAASVALSVGALAAGLALVRQAAP
jgi:CrcB protein